MKKLSMVLLVGTCLVAMSGCRTKDCADQTIFAVVKIGDLAATANQLQIQISRDDTGAMLGQSVDITPGVGDRSVAITFGPGAYPAGVTVKVTITASLSGTALAAATVNRTLSASCERMEFDLGSGLGVHDDGGMGGADFSGCIPDAPMCPAGQCGKVSDGCGNFVACAEPCSVAQVHPRLANASDTVVFEGTFAAGATVDFPGSPGVALSLVGANRATAVVPADATAGALVVHSGNEDLAGGPFRRANAPLALGDWTSHYPQTTGGRGAARLTTARKFEALVQANGHVFAIGGSTSNSGNSSPIATIERARVNADGTLGAPQTLTATPLAAARFGHCAVVLGDKLWVIGGSVGTGSLRSIEWATIQADGTLSTFTLVADALAVPRAFASCSVVGNQLVVVAGVNNTLDLASIEQAPIAADGTVGAFTASSQVLATPRHGHVAFVTPTQLLVVGGNSGGSDIATAEASAITSSGTLGAFATSDAVFPGADSNLTGLQFGNKLYAMPYISTVGADGKPGPFVSAGTAQYGFSHTGETRSVIVRDMLYMLSSSNSDQTTYETFVHTTLNKTGTIGAFAISATASLPEGRQKAGSVVIGDGLFVLGGSSPAAGLSTAIYRAPVNADDSIGTFAATTSALKVARSEYAIAIAHDHVYVLGGNVGAGVSNSVQVAPIAADGSIGAFEDALTTANAVVTLGVARSGLVVFVVGETICALGGYTGSGYSTYQECAPLAADGKFASGFQQTLYFGNLSQIAGLTTLRAWFSSAVVKDKVLAISGASTPSNPTNIESAGWYNISAGGTTMADKFVPLIANALTGGARTYMGSLVVGDGLYILGGSPQTAATLRLDVAALNAPFVATPTADLKVPRDSPSAFLVGNKVYIVGGQGNAALASVEAASLQ